MEYIKKFRKNHSKNVLEEIEGKDELKSVEIGVVTKYIKDQLKSYSDAEDSTDDDSK